MAPAAHGADSVTYQANAQHTGAVDDALSPPLAVRWSWKLGAPSSYPIVAGGRVFVTTASTQGYGSILSAFDAASGALLWQRTLTHTYFWSALAYDNGRLFVLDYDGVLQSIDPATGGAGWGEQLPGQYSFSSAPVAVGGVVYTGGAGSGGTVYAVRESDGHVLWTAPVENGDDSSPSVDNGHVFVSYACNQAYSFNATSGALDWHHATGCEGGGGKTTVVYGGRVYIRDSSGDLMLDEGTGNEVGSFGSVVAPAFSSGVALFMGAGTLGAERTSDRVPLWSFKGDGGLTTAPFVVGSTVYEGTSNGNLYALDRDTGTLEWSTCSGAPIPAPDEQNVSQPLTGLGAGGGLLVVPVGPFLVAYQASPGAASTTCPGTQTTPPTRFAAAGGTSGSGTPPGSAGTQPAALTLRAAKSEIVYGQAVTLTGTAPAGARVGLRADSFPYGSFHTVRSATAGADGKFRFRVRPTRNTAYEAIAGGAVSPATITYVELASRLVARHLPGGRARIAVHVRGPRDLRYARKRVFFYRVARAGNSARRLGSRRLSGKRGRFHATLTMRLTLGRRSHFLACTREKKPDAWGRPTAIDRTCGRRRIRLP